MSAKPRRRWFQFSLRTLLVLMTVAGFGLGYVCYERQLAQQQQKIKADLANLGIQLVGGETSSQRPYYLKPLLGDDSAICSPWVHIGTRDSRSPIHAPEEAREAVSKLRNFPNTFCLIFNDQRIGDADLSNYRELTQIRDVSLQETQVTVRGLEELRGLKSLRFLNLSLTKTDDTCLKEIGRHQDLETLALEYTNVTDAGLRKLRPLKKLKYLSLNKTRVTDKGLVELRELINLEQLVLGDIKLSDESLRNMRPLIHLRFLIMGGPEVNDANLQELANLPALEEVRLFRTSVTDAGVEELKSAIPKLKVDYK